MVLGTLIDEVIQLALKPGRGRRQHQLKGVFKMREDVVPDHDASLIYATQLGVRMTEISSAVTWRHQIPT